MKRHIIFSFFVLASLCQPSIVWAVDDSSLPVIPDTEESFDPAKVDVIPNTDKSKTKAFGAGKRLPPAPRTKAEIIKLMKKPAKTRSGKTRNPKARSYINFNFGSSEIKPDSYSLLYEWASALQSEDLSGATIKVLGHTDNVGSDEANMRLGERRANSVKERLVEDGVIPNRFLLISYGESKPYVSNSTDSGRAVNRRVEFVLDYDNEPPPIMQEESEPEESVTEEEPYYDE